jgi:hypothetical protein
MAEDPGFEPGPAFLRGHCLAGRHNARFCQSSKEMEHPGGIEPP